MSAETLMRGGPLLALALALTASAAAAQVVVTAPERSFNVAPNDPRARPMPSFFGKRPWVRWYCNADGRNCHVLRRHRTRTSCQVAVAFYLAEIPTRTAHCTYEGPSAEASAGH